MGMTSKTNWMKRVGWPALTLAVVAGCSSGPVYQRGIASVSRKPASEQLMTSRQGAFNRNISDFTHQLAATLSCHPERTSPGLSDDEQAMLVEEAVDSIYEWFIAYRQSVPDANVALKREVLDATLEETFGEGLLNDGEGAGESDNSETKVAAEDQRVIREFTDGLAAAIEFSMRMGQDQASFDSVRSAQDLQKNAPVMQMKVAVAQFVRHFGPRIAGNKNCADSQRLASSDRPSRDWMASLSTAGETFSGYASETGEDPGVDLEDLGDMPKKSKRMTASLPRIPVSDKDKAEAAGYYTYNSESSDVNKDYVWGRPQNIWRIRKVGRVLAAIAKERKKPLVMAVGDINRKPPSEKTLEYNTPRHSSHKNGRAVDLRYVGDDGWAAMGVLTNGSDPWYSREDTATVICTFVKETSVYKIYFGSDVKGQTKDTKVEEKVRACIKDAKSKAVLQRMKGHHNHIHIHFVDDGE